MSSTPLTENALSRPAGLVVSLRLLAAIVIFAAIAPGILMTAPQRWRRSWPANGS